MKKLIALITAATLIFAMSMGTFAAVTTGAIKDVDVNNFQTTLKENGAKKLILQGSTAITLDTLSNLSAKPGQEMKIYLTANMFVDNTGARITTESTHISRNQIRAARIALRRSTSRGSKAFKSVSLSYDKVGAYISVKLVDEFVSLNDLDFATTVYLTVNGNRRNATSVTVAGTLAADVVEVYGDDDYVDLSGGRVAEAVERVSRIEVDLGNDLTIFTSMVRGRKYYGTTTLSLTAADSRLMDKYPSVQDVYTLKTINLKPPGNAVYIDRGTRMHVYGADGAYLGTTGQMLPYSTKYYVSIKKYTSIAVQ